MNNQLSLLWDYSSSVLGLTWLSLLLGVWLVEFSLAILFYSVALPECVLECLSFTCEHSGCITPLH